MVMDKNLYNDTLKNDGKILEILLNKDKSNYNQDIIDYILLEKKPFIQSKDFFIKSIFEKDTKKTIDFFIEKDDSSILKFLFNQEIKKSDMSLILQQIATVGTTCLYQDNLFLIIEQYFEQVRLNRAAATRNFLERIDEFCKKYHLNALIVKDISEIAQLMIATQENKTPIINLSLLQKHLFTSHIKAILRRAILLGATVEEEKSLPVAEACHLTIFTEVSWGTLGDYFATARLIGLLKLANPNLVIDWVIRGKLEEIPNEVAESTTLSIHKISDWSEIFTSTAMAEMLEKTQLIFIFPTFHFLTEAQLSTLRSTFEKEIVTCLEYSYGIRKNTPGLIELASGLADDELGIFTHPPVQTHPLALIEHTQPILQVLFSDLFQSNEAETVVINDAQAQHYDSQHILFFGYANKELHRVANPGVNVPNFIDIALTIAKHEHPKKNVDIVVPISEADFAQQNFNYQQYSSVHFVASVDGSLQDKVIYTNPLASDLPQLRVINLFRFDNPTFRLLVSGSHPFKLCTGDQSLSDVVSSGDAIVFYQTMQWKTSLTENYSSIAKTALQEQGIDVSQSCAVKFLHCCKRASTYDIEQIKQLVTDPQLKIEFNVIHQYIRAHKNLNQTLPTYLNAYVHHLAVEKQLLAKQFRLFSEAGEPNTDLQQALAPMKS